MRPLAFLVCLVSLACTFHAPQRARATRAGPALDLVLLVLDDVAAADLALYGGPVPCPALEGLAAQGVRFTRALANPTCAPTRRALLTGRWWLTGNGPSCPGGSIDPHTPALGSLVLPASLPASYTAGLAGKWHLGVNPVLGWPDERAPIAHGFDFWAAGSPTNVGDCPAGGDYTAWLRVDAQAGWHTSATSGVHEAIAVRSAVVTGWPVVPAPRLAVVSANLAHAPFHAPPPGLLPPGYVVGPGPRGRYEAMVAAADGVLAGVLSVVDLSTTLVVVVGDNGTPPNVAPVGSKAKGTTFERGVVVPLVIAGGPVVGGRVVDELVHVVDVGATLLDAAGGSTAGLDGVSLLPLLRDDPGWAAPREWALVGSRWGSTDGDVASVRSDGTKLRQLDADGDGVVESLEFYDLLSDPDEMVNLVSDPSWGFSVLEHLAWTAGALP